MSHPVHEFNRETKFERARSYCRLHRLPRSSHDDDTIATHLSLQTGRLRTQLHRIIIVPSGKCSVRHLQWTAFNKHSTVSMQCRLPAVVCSSHSACTQCMIRRIWLAMSACAGFGAYRLVNHLPECRVPTMDSHYNEPNFP